EPYRAIFLTEAGKALAERSRQRHDIVHRFLLALGVSESTAKLDSEGMEHHTSDETLAIFKQYIENQS
nr:transcriptional regulator MntR [Gammaproteobacteria bacterium]